jgi:hypothetical protein
VLLIFVDEQLKVGQMYKVYSVVCLVADTFLSSSVSPRRLERELLHKTIFRSKIRGTCRGIQLSLFVFL